MKLNTEKFNSTIDGKQTSLHFLENENMQVAITNYGARIVAIILKHNDQNPADVVVGFDSIEGYLNATETYHGTIVGRYANRIANGKFSLEGKEYQLAINNPPGHLHGGPTGFHSKVWDIQSTESIKIKLSLFSPDGEENYPGNLNVSVTYTLSQENELAIHYEASTDQATVINLTSHPFFNLNGIGSGSILDHMLQVEADNYNPVDGSIIPTGIFPVEQTPFDFRQTTPIGERINNDNAQLTYGAGYDHNFVLNGNGLRKVATARGDKSDIMMEVITDQPGMQLYTGNYMKGENKIKGGFKDEFRTAFCLETQHFPDSPNHPEFPTTVLKPGETFLSTTIYKFSW